MYTGRVLQNVFLLANGNYWNILKRALANSFSKNVVVEKKKKICLTELVLHHPDLQLDEAVGVEAVVLSHTAVADFMATQIQLTLRNQRSDFGITDRILFQNVDQAP